MSEHSPRDMSSDATSWEENLSEASEAEEEWYIPKRSAILMQVQQIAQTAETAFEQNSNAKEACEIFSDGVNALVKEIFREATEKRGLEQKSYELCMTGSLSRRDASINADVDFFILIDDDLNKKPIVNVIKDVYQCFVDARKANFLNYDYGDRDLMANTPVGIVEYIASKESGEKLGWYTFVSTSTALSQTNPALHTSLLSSLKGLYPSEKELALVYIENSFKDPNDGESEIWKPSGEPNERVNLKWLLRQPIELITLGLSHWHGITELTISAQANKLLQQSQISVAVHGDILDIYETYLKKRFARGKKRYYDFPIDEEVKDVAVKVRELQERAQSFHSDTVKNADAFLK